MPTLQSLPEGLVTLLLHRSRLLTDKQLRSLLLAVDSAAEVFSLSGDQLQVLGVDWITQQQIETLCLQLADVQNDHSELGQQWRYCLERDIGIVPISSDRYPDLLKQIYDPPPVLYYRGRISLLNRPQLAMVGSRRGSQQGSKNAFQFAKAFAKAGFTITSGMALGIDTDSHRGALAVGGDTIAVLGTGVDVAYPWRNRALYQEIIEQGLIISELALGSEAKKGHFPRRNRIVSGLSLGVLVVEATVKSGSLISARCALEQGREVFAMPGSIHSLASRGCHEIIRQGAKLVETVDHVMEELQGWMPPQSIQPTEQSELSEQGKPHQIQHNLQPEQQAEPTTKQTQALDTRVNTQQQSLLDCIGFDPQPVELIQHKAAMALPELMAALVQLELKGLVENIAGRYQRLV